MTTAELTDLTRCALARVGVVMRRNAVFSRGRYKAGIEDWPDLIGYDRWGRFWAIEVKNEETRDVMRPGQLAAMRQMARRGCEVAIVKTEIDVADLLAIAKSPPPPRGLMDRLLEAKDLWPSS